jgi:lon-related putative ATP-dependent protease
MTALKKASEHETLTADKLRWRCDPDSLGFESTDDLKVCVDIIGQKRALNALRMSFDIESLGYNIFVTGLVGTGRKTAINCLIKESQRLKNIPDDKLYVNNFKDPDRPRLIRLPASRGRSFKKDMEELVDDLIKHIPAIFESENYQERRKDIHENLKNRQKELLKSFEAEVSEKGFTLIQIQYGAVTRPGVLPVKDGKPLNFEQLTALEKEGKLSKAEMEKLEKTQEELTEKINAILKELSDMDRETGEKIKALDDEFVTPLVSERIDEIKETYKCKEVDEYLDEVYDDILSELKKFQKPKAEPLSPLPTPQVQADDPFFEYRVNLLVDNYGAKEAPVIVETSPTYANLFGSLEITADRMGRTRTDFTRIKAGSILKADGGFLIVEALDLLIETGVWPAFKRTLRNRKIEIQNYSTFFLISLSALKPEPIDIDVKVAMVGDPFIYQQLYTRDEDFKKIFKLRADFDSVMDVNNETIDDYANFVKRIVSNEKLYPLNNKAVAAIVEYGVKLAGKQTKLSTQFNNVADVIREANYWCQQEGKKTINVGHVEKAIEEKIDRSRLVEEKIQEMIDDGTIMIDTAGTELGQVNGLSVYQMGDYAFGKPSRITANAAVGSAGIINIEREAELSGPLHNKGVLIISGYFREKYAQDKPLAMSASLCFEQSYGGVDGDSASSTEIYALLSTLSGIPIRQDIAVTGSVNQKGEIQPIGGVNQKIEGFYDVCKAKTLTGNQGVMIPHQNVPDLMLKKEVIDAVKKKKFHIYPVKTIEQGIEILTGVKAGHRQEDGSYEEGTVHQRVDQTLRDFADKWKSFKLD